MTNPINSKPNPSNSDHSQNQSANISTSWYGRVFEPGMHTLGKFSYSVGGPLMTGGFVHACGRKFSSRYLQMVHKYPSGFALFATGLALRAIGGSINYNFDPDFKERVDLTRNAFEVMTKEDVINALKNSANTTISVHVEQAKKIGLISKKGEE